jgi:hypothetical protein
LRDGKLEPGFRREPEVGRVVPPEPEIVKMKILGIDPGSEQSALVFWDPAEERILAKAKDQNESILGRLGVFSEGARMVIEMVACYGMPAGRDLFETAFWVGRFIQAAEQAGMPWHKVYRKDVKLFFCQSMRAKDSNIRQALIDRFGPPGTKKAPGRLYGVKSDEWAALALAVFFSETRGKDGLGAFVHPAGPQDCPRTRLSPLGKGMIPTPAGAVEI